MFRCQPTLKPLMKITVFGSNGVKSHYLGKELGGEKFERGLRLAVVYS